MTEAITIQGPRLYPKQYAAIFAKERYSIIEASTKAGKTLGCIIWQFYQCCAREGEHWWVAPWHPTADIAYKRAKRYIPPSIIAKSNDTEKKIYLINGSTWWFRSAEKTDALYGEDVQSVVIDEASRCRPETWPAIRSTLTKTKGPVRVIGNVKGRKNWFFKLAMKAKNSPSYSHHRLTAWDAVDGGVLDREEVEQAREDLPPEVFAELYEAKAADDGANPFGLQNIDAALVESISDMTPVVFGVDFAKSHDHTVVVGLNKNGDVVSLDRWQYPKWQTTVQRVKQIVGNRTAVVDATSMGDPLLELLQKAEIGIPQGKFIGFQFTKASKQPLMEALALDFGRGKVSIPKNQTVLIDELESFEFSHYRGGVKYEAPAGMHDDCVDALALARKCFRDHHVEYWL